jgi:predicted lipoprotein
MRRSGLASLAALAAAAASGCGGDPPRTDAAPDNFDRPAMLAHLGQHVLLPIQEAFAARAAALPPAVEAYCAALDAGSPGTTLDAARAAWRDAVDAWQAADALLVGPAVADMKTLRERIYAWPLLSSCGLDRDTVTSWTDPGGYDVSTRLPNVRSLTSVEYLLYTTATAHTCATTPPGWDALALGPDLPRARCRLAQRLAADVAVQGAAVRDAWLPGGGDFLGALVRAGQTGSPFSSAHAAVNEISDGMFYVDAMVKDMKLGEAAGLAINACGAVEAPCMRELELGLSDRAAFAIRANLAALRRAFTGTAPAADGPGFDDFLRALGQPELADRMTAALDDAIAKAAALPDSFVGALTTDRDGDLDVDAADYPEIVAAHAAVKLFTDDLKSQFLTVLALEIPDDVATDND